VPNILDNLDLVEQLLRRPPFGLITDADGTISPTAPTPKQARVSPLCNQYLSILRHQLALVAVISGRAAEELKDMVNIEGIIYVGNHGMERLADNNPKFARGVEEYSSVINAATAELTPLLSMEGIIIENKGVTATVHYRLCRERQSARREILAAIEDSPHSAKLRILQEGKYAINLLPPIDVNKGTAVLELIQKYSLRGGIYLGDDTTDIYAFRAIRTACRNLNFRGLAIVIVNEEAPEEVVVEADFTLNGVPDVERLLKYISEMAPPATRSTTQV